MWAQRGVAVPIKGDKPKPGAARNVTGVLSGSGGAPRPDTPTRKNAVSVVGGSGAAGPAADNKVITQQVRDRQPSAGANTSDSKSIDRELNCEAIRGRKA